MGQKYIDDRLDWPTEASGKAFIGSRTEKGKFVITMRDGDAVLNIALEAQAALGLYRRLDAHIRSSAPDSAKEEENSTLCVVNQDDVVDMLQTLLGVLASTGIAPLNEGLRLLKNDPEAMVRLALSAFAAMTAVYKGPK